MIPLVSVIIPVYNVKPYLHECLDSVVKQTYKNLEIIIVDDGSTDGSGQICDEYQKRDDRILVLHQENRGLSAARNVGLDIMHGELVSFLDSDDAFLPSMVETMVNGMKSSKADIVVCGYYVCDTIYQMNKYNFCSSYSPSQKVISSKTALNYLLDERLNITVWNKMYNSSLFDSLRFTEGHMFEDLILLPFIIKIANKIMLISNKLVLYRKRPCSITATRSYNNYRDWIDSRRIFECFVAHNIPSIFSVEQLNKVFITNLHWLIHKYLFLLSTHSMNDSINELFIEAIYMRASLKHAYNLKTKILYSLFKTSPYLCLISVKIYGNIIRLFDRVRCIVQFERINENEYN